MKQRSCQSQIHQPSYSKAILGTQKRDIQNAFEALERNTKIKQFTLCTVECQLFRVNWDLGWGCTYRAIQTIYSALVSHQPFKSALPFSFTYQNISFIQQDIENAWKAGIDEAGAATFSNSLQGKRDWIGAAEVATLLRYHKIDAQIHDFYLSKAQGRGATHSALIEFVARYFTQSDSRQDKLPLFFQTDGHSTVIVGLVELQSKNNVQQYGLALFDSQCRSVPRILPASALKDRAYQIVEVKGVVETDEQYVRNMILIGNVHYS